MKVLIVGSSKLPIPAVKGGAVPNLIEEIIQQNEIEKKVDLSCISLFDEDAVRESKRYPNTEFIWAKTPRWAKAFDRFNYFVLKKIFHVKRLLSLSYAWQIYTLGKFVGKTLKKGDYDRVVFENSVPVLLAMKGRKNAKKYKDKYYLHMHAVPRQYYGIKKQVRNVKKLITVSDYVSKAITGDTRLKMGLEQTAVMRNCIDHEVFHPYGQEAVKEMRQSLGIPEGKKVVMFVGRLCAEKGINELVDAFKKMDRDDALLMIVGSNFYKSGIVSPFEKQLKERMEGIKDKVIFTGYVDYSSIASYYALADVVALPSIWDEPAGMTILETMACGKALITTDSGGIPEYVGEGNCIMLRRDESIVINLANSLSGLLDDQKKIKQLGEKAEKQIGRYNREYYYAQFLDILKQQ